MYKCNWCKEPVEDDRTVDFKGWFEESLHFHPDCFLLYIADNKNIKIVEPP